MKKGLIIIGIASAIIVAYFLFSDKETTADAIQLPAKPLAITSKHSEAFNKSFTQMLNHYFGLKESFVNWDSSSANIMADSLKTVLSRIPYNELQLSDDSASQKVLQLSESIIAEAEGLIGEQTLENKRKSFYVLSEYLYTLIKAVKYDQQVIYHDKCPMAFNDTETAFWISNSEQIVNPYLGKNHPRYKSAMLNCGSIQDSIDYRQ